GRDGRRGRLLLGVGQTEVGHGLLQHPRRQARRTAAAAGAAPPRRAAEAVRAAPAATAGTAPAARAAAEQVLLAGHVGGQLANLLPVESAVLVGVAARDQVLHPFGQFLFRDLAVLVRVERQDPVDDVVDRRADAATARGAVADNVRGFAELLELAFAKD